MKPADSKKFLACVEKHCAERGIRFTDPRRHVLGIIASSEKPVGAYEILARLARVMPNPKPPTAYRAIDFLLEQGFIHRIESLNAFLVCREDHRHDGSQFMICDDCGNVEEAHLCRLPAQLSNKTDASGFQVKSWNVELHGRCNACAQH